MIKVLIEIAPINNTSQVIFKKQNNNNNGKKKHKTKKLAVLNLLTVFSPRQCCSGCASKSRTGLRCSLDCCIVNT